MDEKKPETAVHEKSSHDDLEQNGRAWIKKIADQAREDIKPRRGRADKLGYQQGTYDDTETLVLSPDDLRDDCAINLPG